MPLCLLHLTYCLIFFLSKHFKQNIAKKKRDLTCGLLKSEVKLFKQSINNSQSRRKEGNVIQGLGVYMKLFQIQKHTKVHMDICFGSRTKYRMKEHAWENAGQGWTAIPSSIHGNILMSFWVILLFKHLNFIWMTEWIIGAFLNSIENVKCNTSVSVHSTVTFKCKLWKRFY